MNARGPVVNGEIVWPCAACGHPVDDGDGYLGVDLTRAVDAWNDPWHEGPVEHWQTMHIRCAEENLDESTHTYQIDIERIRTPLQVLAWTMHLSEKGWLSETDWRTLIYELTGGLH